MSPKKGSRPAAPQPLEDDIETGYGAPPPMPAPGAYAEDEGETQFPGAAGQSGSYDDEPPTDIPDKVVDETEIEPSEAEHGPLGLLWVREGMRRGKAYLVKDGCRIGREEGDIALDDPKVSEPHAKIKYEETGFVIVDFLSKNGTHVNGKKIAAVTPLKENSIVKIGDTIFVFKILD